MTTTRAADLILQFSGTGDRWPARLLEGLKGGEVREVGAALFLQEFVTRPWAHLDMAGNADQDGRATGWGVGTLVEYLLGE